MKRVLISKFRLEPSDSTKTNVNGKAIAGQFVIGESVGTLNPTTVLNVTYPQLRELLLPFGLKPQEASVMINATNGEGNFIDVDIRSYKKGEEYTNSKGDKAVHENDGDYCNVSAIILGKTAGTKLLDLVGKSIQSGWSNWGKTSAFTEVAEAPTVE